MYSNEFLFGVQYYRAPTPEEDSWEDDLKNIRSLGFRHVKFWVQWRWTHRAEDEFYFDDIDRLMELAQQNGLKVTLNVIFDVAPKWFTDRHPESLMIRADGSIVEPVTACYRQIGGFPGPCYNHQAAFEERMRFLSKTVERYRNHPAMHMWDVWNEPEQCSPNRAPVKEKLVCYCPECSRRFRLYLRAKYGTVEALNKVWGRCYTDFEDVELPKETGTFQDFIDFREFHLEKMTAEATSRLRVVKALDKNHSAYLHVVPNTSGIFNGLTGVDDFALAKECDVFASTNFAQPVWSILTLSAGAGKTCYNVECHVGAGSTRMHQKQITPADLVHELLPQIGLGIRGFLFWQYRAELLGFESPSWGVTKPDGTPGSVGIASKQFIEKLTPYLPQIMAAKAPRPQIAVWKGRKNEIFSFCVNDSLTDFAKSTEAYVNAAYKNSISCCIVDDGQIIEGLEGIRMLVMPDCYAADAALMRAVDRFVLDGGLLLCEAHLGAYDLDAGRHSMRMPGFGMDTRWGICEKYTTSSYHLKNLQTAGGQKLEGVTGDVRKALDAIGVSGGKYFPVNTSFGVTLAGAERFACLEASDAQVIGSFGDEPCIIYKRYGSGAIMYCGTDLGKAADISGEAFSRFVAGAAALAGIQKELLCTESGVHVDRISDSLLAVNNMTDHAVVLGLNENWHSAFGECKATENGIEIAAASAELLVCETE